MFVFRPLAAATLLFTAACAQAQDPGPAAGPGDAGQDCAFAAQHFESFAARTPTEGARNGFSALWLTLDESRSELEALLTQEDRERGPNAPYAMGYRPEFARAVEALSPADIDRFHAALGEGGAIDCAQIDTGSDPFTDDLRGFIDWAEGQMMNPDPGAPEGAQSLAMSRPILFDEGRRVLFAESYTYTPIPLSRPPSALLTFVVQVRGEQGWDHEASLLLARSG